jgi:hypothetical protein
MSFPNILILMDVNNGTSSSVPHFSFSFFSNSWNLPTCHTQPCQLFTKRLIWKLNPFDFRSLSETVWLFCWWIAKIFFSRQIPSAQTRRGDPPPFPFQLFGFASQSGAPSRQERPLWESFQLSRSIFDLKRRWLKFLTQKSSFLFSNLKNIFKKLWWFWFHKLFSRNIL